MAIHNFILDKYGRSNELEKSDDEICIRVFKFHPQYFLELSVLDIPVRFLRSNKCSLVVQFPICDALRYLVPFVQFIKRENTQGGVLSCRLKPATLLKLTLVNGCFSRFLNCTNGIKSSNASHTMFDFFWNKFFIQRQIKWRMPQFLPRVYFYWTNSLKSCIKQPQLYLKRQKLEIKFNLEILFYTVFIGKLPKFRSSCREMLYKSDVFENSAKFTGKYMCWSLIYDNVAGCCFSSLSGIYKR